MFHKKHGVTDLIYVTRVKLMPIICQNPSVQIWESFVLIYIGSFADRTRLDLNHAEMINATTNICE